MIRTGKNIEQYVIRCLAAQPLLTAADLHRKIIALNGKQYSIQGLYKELRKLHTSGVIFKLKDRYSLQFSWVLDYLSLGETLSARYIERAALSLPDVYETKVWRFTNLLKMNDFWSHVLLTLVQKSKHKVLLGWNPHPWFHLVQTKQEGRYIKSLKKTRSRLYLIVGGDTVLDRWTEKFWDKDVVRHSYGKSSFHSERSTYINVMDDYVVTVKLKPQMAREIDAIYSNTKSWNDLDLSSVLSIFHESTIIQFRIERNPEKAKKIETQFKNFWGHVS